MLNNNHVQDLLAAYALGSLDDEEAAQVAEHMAVCSTCLDELRAYQFVTDRLALASPDATPSEGLKQRILDRIQAPRLEPATLPGESWWKQIAGLFRQSAPAWGIASLALVVLLVISNVWWWQRTQREEPMVTPGGMRVVAMAGTNIAPSATGTLVISDDGEYGTLVVDGLPPLDAEHQYQLWLIRDGQRTSGGVFTVNPEGYGALWISSIEPLASFPAFGVTVEPLGGSSGPTGDKVLGGNL